LLDSQVLNLLAYFAAFAQAHAPVVERHYLLLLLLQLAVYVGQEVLGALFKVLVHVNIVALGMADLLEPVHVQLTDKRSKIMMFEVRGKHFLSEPSDIFNNERITCGSPAHDLLNFSILARGKGTSTI
jgi:hypothetical protein